MGDFITIKLTRQQAESLGDILNSTQDDGPDGEGWASAELQELRSLVDCEIELAKKA